MPELKLLLVSLVQMLSMREMVVPFGPVQTLVDLYRCLGKTRKENIKLTKGLTIELRSHFDKSMFQLPQSFSLSFHFIIYFMPNHPSHEISLQAVLFFFLCPGSLQMKQRLLELEEVVWLLPLYFTVWLSFLFLLPSPPCCTS